MKKLIKDILTEHGEYSIKRVLVLVFATVAAYFAIKMAYTENIADSHLYLLGELFSFIGILLGLTVANKHEKLRTSTNKTEG